MAFEASYETYGYGNGVVKDSGESGQADAARSRCRVARSACPTA